MKVFVKSLLVFVFFVSFLFIGCATKPVSYSFIEDEQKSSSISFQKGNADLKFLSFDGRGDKPKRGTHWDPVIVPSERELRIVVFAKYNSRAPVRVITPGLLGQVVDTATSINETIRNVSTEVVFLCPPLETGKRYMLSFVKESGLPGKNILILTDLETNNVVHQQEFQTIIGGYTTR